MFVVWCVCFAANIVDNCMRIYWLLPTYIVKVYLEFEMHNKLQKTIKIILFHFVL